MSALVAEAPASTRVWRPDWACSVAGALRPLRRGSGDPCYRVVGDVHWRGLLTPEGPATLAVRGDARSARVDARAWGAGAAWVLDRLPRLLGDEDDPSGFVPRHPAIAEGQRRGSQLRFGRTDLMLESLVPAVLEQKVTGREAFGAHRGLVRGHGEPAPGPGPTIGLWVPPTAARIRQVPSWEWLRLGVEPARSRTVLEVCARADSLERLAAVPSADTGPVDRALRSLRGVGVWTSAEVRQRVHGDPDAVSFGDYHLAKQVGWALFGHDIDDAALAEVLEPYRPQRGRAALYALIGGRRRPRRGPG